MYWYTEILQKPHACAKKTWKVHVNIIVSPVTLTDVHDHLYGYGGFPPLVDVKIGLLGMHPKPNCKGDTVLNIDPGMANSVNHGFSMYATAISKKTI